MWTRHKEASFSWKPKMNFLLPPIPTPGFPSLSWQLVGTVPDSVSVCHTNSQVSVRKSAALGVAETYLARGGSWLVFPDTSQLALYLLWCCFTPSYREVHRLTDRCGTGQPDPSKALK